MDYTTAQEAGAKGRGGRNRQVSRLLYVVLPLMVLLCLSLWYLRNFYRVSDLIRVEPQNGIYDLTDIDFSTSFVRLQGDLEYIPGILTPEEFAARGREAVTGPYWELPSATTRMVIRMPDDGRYMITRASADYAYRAYLNGELRYQAGVPAEDAEDFRPGYSQMQLEVTPENGVIEIVQQSANFVHRTGGGHGGIYLGRPAAIQRFLALTFGLEFIKAGLFAALFLVHLLLFAVRRSFRSNLYFSILCLTWAFRSTVTGAKVLYALFPALPWQAAFRGEYMSLPIACIFLVLLAREIFPGVLKPWFVKITSVASVGFLALCLAADTVILSWALIGFEGVLFASICCLCIWFAVKIPSMVRKGQLRTEQMISLAGYIFFMYATIHDVLYYLDVPYYLGLTVGFTLTGPAMLIFSFFQMTAILCGTMREAALAHERELRAEAEKEMLAEMSRLKNSFYTDMSHEMKTPLTVIAVNAQFAAQNVSAGVVDEETVTDLNAISAEARRLAQMVTSLVGIGRMQGSGSSVLSLTLLLTETARIYQSLFDRRNNTLTVETAPDLPSVEGNADQIVQVLINLLSNANRHTKAGKVAVRAETMAGYVRVSVTDNGEGISPDLLPHVFERFCHGKKGGSGLGLSICKTIIEEHGGKIDIESEEGRGTKVWFTLPIKEETEDERDGDHSAGGRR